MRIKVVVRNKIRGGVMEIIVCNNSACQHWKDDHYNLLDKTAHCPIYEGQELLNGDCSDFTTPNKKLSEIEKK